MSDLPRKLLIPPVRVSHPELYARVSHALFDAAQAERQRHPDQDVSIAMLGVLADAAAALALKFLEEERERLGLHREGGAH